MKIAIIGTGISGNTLAYLLSKHKNISLTIFESDQRMGGHTHTHEIMIDGQKINVDTGFIVFNKKTYPLFTKLLKFLKVKIEKSNMSFSVFSPKRNFEYNGTSFDSLFSQRKNIFNIRFIKMLFEILRFNKQSIKILGQKKEISLGSYLKGNNYSNYFIHNYILPMGAAIWSSDIKTMLEFPALFFIRFFHNHGMLSVNKRPQWYTISDGSNSYLTKLTKPFKNSIRLNSRIKKVIRQNNKIKIQSNFGNEIFDYIFFACHSDQALSLLDKPTSDEISILRAIPYKQNKVVLHTDTSVMPKNKKTWAAWNYNIDNTSETPIKLTYYMNTLQNLKTKTPVLVSLNNYDIDKKKIIKKINYTHPHYSLKSIEAQKNIDKISGHNRTYYLGAYWGNGFHEDGVKSAYKAYEKFIRR